MRKVTLIPVTAVFAAGAIAAAGCGNTNSSASTGGGSKPATTAAQPATATAGNGTVDVTLSEWAVKPSVSSAKAGKVKFVVTNDGKAAHEMVVIRTKKQAADLGKGARISEAGSVGEAGDIPAGGTKSVTLKLKPGHYALVCNVDGHYMAGMHTDFTVS